jgi:hypothetical protein
MLSYARSDSALTTLVWEACPTMSVISTRAACYPPAHDSS